MAIYVFLALWAGFGALVILFPRRAWLTFGAGPRRGEPITADRLNAVSGPAVIIMRIVGAAFIVMAVAASLSVTPIT